jgi:hypothetical protein
MSTATNDATPSTALDTCPPADCGPQAGYDPARARQPVLLRRWSVAGLIAQATFGNPAVREG